jgi:hypothetical protein
MRSLIMSLGLCLLLAGIASAGCQDGSYTVQCYPPYDSYTVIGGPVDGCCYPGQGHPGNDCYAIYTVECTPRQGELISVANCHFYQQYDENWNPISGGFYQNCY